jgi:hypothetical protein
LIDLEMKKPFVPFVKMLVNFCVKHREHKGIFNKIPEEFKV